jgi:PPOX class probable F420-dependent enzyme
VPICFVLIDHVAWSPLDEKPKTVSDPLSLARVRDIWERPEVTLLVQRWSEDWAELAWVRVEGHATVLEAGSASAGVAAALRTKYPQYADHDLEARPMIEIRIDRVTSWGTT